MSNENHPLQLSQEAGQQPASVEGEQKTERYLSRKFVPIWLSAIADGKTENSLRALKVQKKKLADALRDLDPKHLPEGETPDTLLEKLMGYHSIPVTTQDFYTFSTELKQIVMEGLLGPTPTVMLPFHDVGKDQSGMVNYRVADRTSRYRGVSLVSYTDNGEPWVALVEGRNSSMLNFYSEEAHETMNVIAAINLQNELAALSIDDISKELLAASDQHRKKVTTFNRSRPGHQAVPMIALEMKHIKGGLEAIVFDLPIDRKFPTKEEFQARDIILHIINYGAISNPLGLIAFWATAGTPDQLKVEDLSELDKSLKLLEMRLSHSVNWADVMSPFMDQDKKPTWVSWRISTQLLRIARDMQNIDKQTQLNAEQVREALLTKALTEGDANTRAQIRRIEADTNYLVLEDGEDQKRLGARYDNEVAALEAETAQEVALLEANTLMSQERRAAAKQWLEQFSAELHDYRDKFMLTMGDTGERLRQLVANNDQAVMDFLLQSGTGSQILLQLADKFENAQQISARSTDIVIEPNITDAECEILGPLMDHGYVQRPPQIPANVPKEAVQAITVVYNPDNLE